MKENMDALLRLKGTQEEREWLLENLETLSVREGTILAAALEWRPPDSMSDVVNHVLSLEEYEVRYQAGNYEQLGAFRLREDGIPKELWEYVDQTALGRTYEQKHPGQFVDGCYVEYPERKPPQWCSDGYLPKADDWSVRLKLASKQVPDGVWVKLPDYHDMNDEPGDIRMALDALQVRTVQECTLLDAKCILPEIRDLRSQYDDLLELIYDGQNLGVLLDEQGQGMPGFHARFAAAMDYENCHQLRAAVDIAQNLSSYEYVPALKLREYAMEDLADKGLLEKVQKYSESFAYEEYAAELLQRDGYIMTADELGFVLRNDGPEQIQSPGMTMQ